MAVVRRKIGSNLGGKINIRVRVRVSVEVVEDELLLGRGRGEEKEGTLGGVMEKDERGDQLGEAEA